MKIENGLTTSFLAVQRQEQRLNSRMVKSVEQEDQVSISLPKSKLDGVESVRQDRVDAVKARIANGYYDQPEVREAIATAFLRANVA